MLRVSEELRFDNGGVLGLECAILNAEELLFELITIKDRYGYSLLL